MTATQEIVRHTLPRHCGATQVVAANCLLHTLPRLRAAEQVEKVKREGREGREDLVVKPGADVVGHQIAAGGGPRSDAPAFSQTMGTKVPKALKLDTKRHRKTVDQRRQAEASRQEMKFRMLGQSIL